MTINNDNQQLIPARLAPLDVIRTDSHFVVDDQASRLLNRRHVAYIAESLCRVTSGQRREGVKDLARALGIKEVSQ